MKIIMPAESMEGVVYKGDMLRGSGDGPSVSAIIVSGTPTSDNEPKGSYTFGGAYILKGISCWRSSALGALADLPGFSTDALMQQKASEKRREHRWSE